jgi:hypothetical protein
MNNMKYQGADQPVARKHIQDSRKIWCIVKKLHDADKLFVRE